MDNQKTVSYKSNNETLKQELFTRREIQGQQGPRAFEASGESSRCFGQEKKTFGKVDWRPHHDLYSRRSIKKFNKKSMYSQQKLAIEMMFLEAAMQVVKINGK